jgi:hypothetical protein
LKLRVVSEEQFITASIADALKNLKQDAGNEGIAYSTTIESSIAELVRLEMRKIAQKTELGMSPEGGDLLSQAIQAAQLKLKMSGADSDLRNYLNRIRTALRTSANEIFQLGSELRRSKDTERIGKPVPFSSKAQVQYEIKEVGLQGAIEGLLAYPLSDGFEIDMEMMKALYKVEGDWFPFGLNKDGFVYVIDDDGSAFVATQHFSAELIGEARNILRQIADELYT